jgi:hypothetical protein
MNPKEAMQYERSIIFAFRMYEVGQSEINIKKVLKRVFPSLETKYEEIMKKSKTMFDEQTDREDFFKQIIKESK